MYNRSGGGRGDGTGPRPWSVIPVGISLLLLVSLATVNCSPTTSPQRPLYTLQVEVREPNWERFSSGLHLPNHFFIEQHLDRVAIGYAKTGEQRIIPKSSELQHILSQKPTERALQFHCTVLQCNPDDGTLHLDVHCPPESNGSSVTVHDELVRLLLFYTDHQYHRIGDELSNTVPSNALIYHAAVWERVLSDLFMPNNNVQDVVAHLIRTFTFTDVDVRRIHVLLHESGIDPDDIFTLPSVAFSDRPDHFPNSGSDLDGADLDAEQDLGRRLAAHLVQYDSAGPRTGPSPSLKQLTYADLVQRLDPDRVLHLARQLLAGRAGRTVIPALVGALSALLPQRPIPSKPGRDPVLERNYSITYFLNRISSSTAFKQLRSTVLAQLAQHPFALSLEEIVIRPNLIVIEPIPDIGLGFQRYLMHPIRTKESMQRVYRPGSVFVLNPISIPDEELLQRTPIDDWLPIFSDIQKSAFGSAYEVYYDLLFFDRATILIRPLTTSLREDLCMMLRDQLNLPYWLLGELIRAPISLTPSNYNDYCSYELPYRTDIDLTPSVVVLFWAHILDQSLPPPPGRTLSQLVTHFIEHVYQIVETKQLPDPIINALKALNLRPEAGLPVPPGAGIPLRASAFRSSQSDSAEECTAEALVTIQAMLPHTRLLLHAVLAPALYRDADSVMTVYHEGFAFELQLRCPEEVVTVEYKAANDSSHPSVSIGTNMVPVAVPHPGQAWDVNVLPEALVRIRPILKLLDLVRLFRSPLDTVRGHPCLILGVHHTMYLFLHLFLFRLKYMDKGPEWTPAVMTDVRQRLRNQFMDVLRLLPFLDAEFRFQVVMSEPAQIAARLCGQQVCGQVRRLLEGVADPEAARPLARLLDRMETQPMFVAALMHQLRAFLLTRGHFALGRFLAHWNAVTGTPNRIPDTTAVPQADPVSGPV